MSVFQGNLGQPGFFSLVSEENLFWGELMAHVFFGLDVLPVTQPKVSEHWRKHKALTPTSGQVSSFLCLAPDSLHQSSNASDRFV